jgi:hypothetical protein
VAQKDFCNSIERITDSGLTSREVRKVPTTEVAALLNHLVGNGKKGWRNVYIQRLCRFDVDDQLEFRRSGHRGALACAQISRFGELAA